MIESQVFRGQILVDTGKVRELTIQGFCLGQVFVLHHDDKEKPLNYFWRECNKICFRRFSGNSVKPRKDGIITFDK